MADHRANDANPFCYGFLIVSCTDAETTSTPFRSVTRTLSTYVPFLRLSVLKLNAVVPTEV